MPTPQARILASETVTDAVMRRNLFDIYLRQFNALKKDLTRRLRDHAGGIAAWGGGENPAATAKALAQSLKRLKTRLLSTGLVNEVLGGMKPLDTAFLQESAAWSVIAAEKAPAWLRSEVPDLAKKYKTYISEGSLVEAKLKAGAYKKGGVFSQHARCYERTSAVLQQNLHAGKSYFKTMRDIQENVWGVQQGALNAPSQNGVIADIKRLMRTEYQYAHNSSRQDLGKADPATIGYIITLDADACQICEGLYGQRRFLYAKDETYMPPSESHPNCHCTVSGYIYRKPDISLIDKKYLVPED